MPDPDHNNRLALTQRLLLEAGRLMEDASPDLALALPNDAAALDERIAAVEAVATDLAVLASAARALFRISTQPD